LHFFSLIFSILKKLWIGSLIFLLSYFIYTVPDPTQELVSFSLPWFLVLLCLYRSEMADKAKYISYYKWNKINHITKRKIKKIDYTYLFFCVWICLERHSVLKGKLFLLLLEFHIELENECTKVDSTQRTLLNWRIYCNPLD
jgi:hypothetical protein